MTSESRTMNGPPAESWGKLGLGTGTLASLGRAATCQTVVSLLSAMRDGGANLIDTADSYGSGDCEILLGKALKQTGGDFHIVTKAGYCLSNLGGVLRPLNQLVKKGIQRYGNRTNFSKTYLTRCLDNSLRRLRVDRVDTFLLHDADLSILNLAEITDFFLKIQPTGKFGRFGISSGNVEVIQLALTHDIFQVIQTPANLAVSLPLLPLWHAGEKRGIQFIGNHVFSPHLMAMPHLNRELMMRACAALMPPSATILCGTKNPSHFSQTSTWANHPLPLEEAERLALEHSVKLQKHTPLS